MDNQLIFKFKTDLTLENIPEKLNNPFEVSIPEIAKIAAIEFQEFISQASKKWTYDFSHRQGKMFGVLVVKSKNGSLGYLGTVSGKISREDICDQFIPSVFDDATDNFFINKGMTELSAMINRIKETDIPEEKTALKAKSKQKSIALQQRLFENYHFSNTAGQKLGLLDIFKQSSHGKPPAASGECAAPKLLQYAIENELKPIALAEFWWGNPISSRDRQHKAYYPACKSRCRPILEFMLEDSELFAKSLR